MRTKAEIAADHDARAKARRQEASLLLGSGVPDKEAKYEKLMLLVGFHTIQSNLWYKSLADFGERSS